MNRRPDNQEKEKKKINTGRDEEILKKKEQMQTKEKER